MNGVDPRLVDRIQQEAALVPGVATVREVQVRWEGHRLHADLAVGVSPLLSITEAHALAHTVEHELLHHIAHLDHVNVHVEPEDPSRGYRPRRSLAPPMNYEPQPPQHQRAVKGTTLGAYNAQARDERPAPTHSGPGDMRDDHGVRIDRW